MRGQTRGRWSRVLSLYFISQILRRVSRKGGWKSLHQCAKF